MLRFAFALVLMVLGAAVAAADGPPGPVVLHRGNLAEPDTLDPQKWFTTYEAEILRDLFVGLLQIDADAREIPGAAERWEITPDGLTLTFHLRPDGKWSDGVPVTAEDFVTGLRRCMNPKTASPYANMGGFVIRNSRPISEGKMPVDRLGVRAVDALTLEITLERPSQTFLWLLAAYPQFAPVPTHLLKASGDAWIQPGTMVSNGPFVLANWVPNDYVLLRKNANFFDAKAVLIDEVYYEPTDDDAAAVKQFRAGELDLNVRFPPGQYQMLKRDLPAQTLATPASWIGYAVLNQTDPRFADARVRKALSLALDRETIVNKVLNNGELPAWSFVPPMTRNFTSSGAGDFSKMTMPERQAEARRLLAEAGYDAGHPLAFAFQHRIGEANKRVALAMRDMWRAVGVDVVLQPTEVKVHYARLREMAFEVADGGWSMPPDAEFFIYLLRSDSVEVNFGGWHNAAFDRLADLGNAEQDVKKRGDYYAAAEKIALDDTALIPVYIPVERALVQTWVKGFRQNAVNYHPTRWLSIER
ncbi:MAG: peptide ABC transporter substrate-binding protein [Alphaproteobacteria bacterium]|nr:peptide ABC transporter substrate-binding protein [Alphaproteobacteria bacterium]